MWSRAAAIALFLAPLIAHADRYKAAFDTVDHEFWRPTGPSASDMIIRVQGDGLTLSTRCFLSGLAFGPDGDGISFGNNEFVSSYMEDVSCASQKSAFEALKSSLLTAKAFHTSDGRFILKGENGKELLAAEPIAAKGFEFQELAVVSFRHAGRLWHVKSLSGQNPDLAFYNGRIDGSVGCGGADGTYEAIRSARYRIFLTSMLAGMCDNLDRSMEQVQRILDAFNGVREFEKRKDNFIFRDEHGHVQIVLSPVVRGAKP